MNDGDICVPKLMSCLCCPAGVMKILMMIANSLTYSGLPIPLLPGVLTYKKRNNDEEEHSIGLPGGKVGCLSRGTIFIFAYHLIVFYF